MRISGKRALVTGGSSGIGRGVAEALVAEGAEVYNFDMNYVDIPGIKTIKVDLTDWEATDKCLEELGPVDLLFNNAGILRPLTPFTDVKKEDLDKTIEVNLKAPFHIGQAVAKGMIKAGKGGSIVNTSRLGAFIAAPDVCTCITKAGLQMMTKCMALELGAHNIRVNSVNPGIVLDTGIGRDHFSNSPKTEAQRSRIPLGRHSKVNDVVGAVLFLLNSEAGMITGSALAIDGGYLIS